MSSIRSTPGLVGQYHYHRPLHLNLHRLVIPPRGQLHTAEPSVRLRNAWGGVRRGTLLLPRLDYISTHAPFGNLEITSAHHS